MFIWIYLLDVYFYISTSFDSTYNTHNVLSKRTSKTDKFAYWKKIVLIIIFTFFDGMTQWAFICIIASISLLSFFIYVKELPDYNHLLLYFKLIGKAIFLWSGICLILIKIIQSITNFESGIILFFIGIPLIFGIAEKWQKGKLSKLLVHHSKFSKPFEFLNRIFIINKLIDTFDSRYSQFTLRGYVNKMEEFCTLDTCPLKKYLHCMNNKEEAIGYLLMYIETVFQVGISRNPNDITLRICYIHFLIAKLNKIHKAYLELIYCETLDRNIEEDFIIYRHKKQFGENGDFNFSEELDESGLNILFQNNFLKFKNLLIKVSFLYIDFWSLLYENQMEEQQDMTVLNEYGNQINLGVEEVHKLFNKLQKIKENEPELLELYAEFLREIREDYEQSNELNQILKKVHKRLKHDDMDELNWLNSFNIDIYALNNNDKNLYLVFDTKLNNFGTILNVSLGLCSILGYPKEEIKGKHINLLIPDIFQASHKSLLFKLIEEYQKGHHSRKKVDYSYTDSFAMSKSKYLVPFNFKACVISNDSGFYWLLKVNKENSYFTNFNSIDLNTSNYNTFTIITNKQFIIQYFTSNCVKFLGLKASEIVGVSDISHFIKEFHEEFLKYAIENEDQDPEEKLKIKQQIVKINYKNQTQITWLKRDYQEFSHSNNNEYIEKKKENKQLYLTVSEIIIDNNLDGYIFKFEISPHKSLFSSLDSQSHASKTKSISHENSISKKNSRIHTVQTLQLQSNSPIETPIINKRRSLAKYEIRNFSLTPMPSITGVIDRNFIPKIPKVGGFKFNPNILSYQININEKNTDRRKFLKEKAMNKVKEIYVSSSPKTDSSNEELSEFTDSCFESSNGDSSVIEKEKKIKTIKNSTTKASDEDYYHINFSKIRLKIYDYKTKGFIEKNYEKKSKVEMVINNPKQGDDDDDQQYVENAGIQQVQSKEENEKDIQQKREMLLQQIEKSLLQEDTQATITTLRLISLVLFTAIICYGIGFLIAIINNFSLYKDKYYYIKYSFAIYRGVLHAVSIIRELVLIAFNEYNELYTEEIKEKYRYSLLDSLTTLYIRMSESIDQLTKKSAQLSQENYQTVFGTILPTYTINDDYTVNIFNLTYISTVSKAVTGIYEITQLDIDEFMPLNKDIYFFITNTLNGILTDTRIAENTYTDQLYIIIHQQKKNLLIIYIVISILNIVSYFILNKAFMDVEARKNSYLEVFFEIKGNLIISSLTKCEAFVKRLQNTDGDDIISIQDDDDNDDGENSIQNHKNLSNEGEGNKVISGNVILIHIVLIGFIIFIEVYFLVIIIFFYDFSEKLKYYIILYNHESRLEMNNFLIYTYIREYIFDQNSIVNGTNIYQIIDNTVKQYTINQQNNYYYLKKYQHLYGKNYSNYRYSIYQNDICNFTQNYFDEYYPNRTDINCYSFLDGGAKYGLDILHFNFFEELRAIKAKRESYSVIWKNHNFTYNYTLFNTDKYDDFEKLIKNETERTIYNNYSPLSILISEKMKNLTIVFEYYLSPIYMQLFDSLDEVIMTYIHNKKILLNGMCITYISLFVLIYLFIWRIHVENLNTIIYQTKRMLAIIPKDILASLKSIGKLLDIKTQSAHKISSEHKPIRVSSKNSKKTLSGQNQNDNGNNNNNNTDNNNTNKDNNINIISTPSSPESTRKNI